MYETSYTRTNQIEWYFQAESWHTLGLEVDRYSSRHLQLYQIALFINIYDSIGTSRDRAFIQLKSAKI